MKLLHVVMLLTVVLAPRISIGVSLEEASPAFAAGMPIVWAVSTNHIPKSLRTYKVVRRIFSAPVRQRRAVLYPDEVELDYFTRVKALGAARKLTITKITPYWAEGRFGEDKVREPEKLPDNASNYHLCL